MGINVAVRVYAVFQICSVLLVLLSLLISLILPGPRIDAAWPYYWPLVGRIELSLIFVAGTIMWVSAAYFFIAHDNNLNFKIGILYLVPMLLGLNLSFLVGGLYFA